MAYFTVEKDTAGEWRWSLKANNHRIIADSGEGYNSKVGCITAAKNVRSDVSTAKLYQSVTDPQTRKSEWQEIP